MDENAAWYGSRPRPRPHCTRRGPSSRKGAQQLPIFGPCVLWPRSPISATAELLFSFPNRTPSRTRSDLLEKTGYELVPKSVVNLYVKWSTQSFNVQGTRENFGAS